MEGFGSVGQLMWEGQGLTNSAEVTCLVYAFSWRLVWQGCSHSCSKEHMGTSS